MDGQGSPGRDIKVTANIEAYRCPTQTDILVKLGNYYSNLIEIVPIEA